MKKKILLAAAVAVACGAPLTAMAEMDFYGHFRYSLNSTDADDGNGSTLSGNDNVSLFGIKASAKGDGITAFAHLQSGAIADAGGAAFGQRFYFGGLKGDFGTVAYGRMTNAYKMPGFKLDPFYNMSHIGAGGTAAAGGATYGLSGATNGFTDNALQYTSPSMNGLKVNVGLYIDDTGGATGDEHGNNIGVKYSGKNYHVGLQMASNGANTTVPSVIADGDAMRIDGAYKADSWSAGFSYETVDLSATLDANYMYLVGKYNISKKTQAVLSLGSVSEGAAKGSGMNIGVFQTVAPKTQVYVTHSSASLDNAVNKDPSVISIGAIHKF